jgi:hypothetical protein
LTPFGAENGIFLARAGCIDRFFFPGVFPVITLSRTRPNRYKGCQRCRVIRLYMSLVLMLVMLALLAGDRMAYLRFLTAENIAGAIWVVGFTGFVVKFILWRLEAKRQRSGPEQA